jgi:hypothetical protein
MVIDIMDGQMVDMARHQQRCVIFLLLLSFMQHTEVYFVLLV